MIAPIVNLVSQVSGPAVVLIAVGVAGVVILAWTWGQK